MHFLFHAEVFDDIMRFRTSKTLKFEPLNKKRAFEVKLKIFFPVSKFLSFKLEKTKGKI